MERKSDVAVYLRQSELARPLLYNIHNPTQLKNSGIGIPLAGWSKPVTGETIGLSVKKKNSYSWHRTRHPAPALRSSKFTPVPPKLFFAFPIIKMARHHKSRKAHRKHRKSHRKSRRQQKQSRKQRQSRRQQQRQSRRQQQRQQQGGFRFF